MGVYRAETIIVDTAAELPTASSGNEGWYAYAKDTNLAYYSNGSAWTAVGNTVSQGYPYGKYDMMNPLGCASDGDNVCEEWLNGVADQTWEWGNQGTATETLSDEGALLSGTTTDQLRVRWTDPPLSGNTDFTISAVMRSYVDNTATGDGFGVAILHGGTVASPTDIVVHGWVNSGTDSWQIQNWSDYATPTFIASINASINDTSWFRHVVQLRYVDSTRVTTAAVGKDQDQFFGVQSSTKTLSADPIKVGYFVRRDASVLVESFRVRVDDLTRAGA